MSDFKELFERYLDGHLTKDELTQLMDGMQADDSPLPDLLDSLLRSGSVAGLGDPAREDVLFSQMMERARSRRVVHMRRWWAAAAVALLLAGGAVYYTQKHSPVITAAAQPVKDAPPGKKGAVLTLADGSTITLDSLQNGAIAKQSGKAVILKNGRISYQGQHTDVAYNTLSTARGREFQLVLPDGTKVWLNAASSIHYPTAFTGKDRTVDITGEAYFEVAKNENQPFIVTLNETTSIEVLGTHFNVNAYPDESAIRTTLTEGAVRVRSGNASVVLEPGLQAAIGQQHNIRVNNANMEQVLAWKEGLFNFENMPFDEVMRQLSRWYNIDVVYENGIPDINFEGELGRDVSLSKILFFLERVDVHYRIEDGKRLVISK
jgi:transmembrane sensor